MGIDRSGEQRPQPGVVDLIDITAGHVAGAEPALVLHGIEQGQAQFIVSQVEQGSILLQVGLA